MDDVDADLIYKIKFKKDLIFDIDCVCDYRCKSSLTEIEKFHVCSSILKKLEIPWELIRK